MKYLNLILILTIAIQSILATNWFNSARESLSNTVQKVKDDIVSLQEKSEESSNSDSNKQEVKEEEKNLKETSGEVINSEKDNGSNK